MFIKGAGDRWVNLDKAREIRIEKYVTSDEIDIFRIYADLSDNVSTLLKKVATLKKAEKYVERLLRRMRKR